MPNSPHQSKARLLTPALLGSIAGIALQLQQAELWAPERYGGLALAGLVALLPLRWLRTSSLRALLVLAALGALTFSGTGLRATLFLQQALRPGLEGQDINVTGHVSAMPQFGDNGTRFRYTAESATLDGETVPIPPQLYLSWYGSGRNDDGVASEPVQTAPALQAGERWQFTVRLRAPHGARNPHGFDFELWLWEQGLQATGYVRTGKRDPQPQRLAQTWQHPVELARQQVRDAILQRAPAGDDPAGCSARDRPWASWRRWSPATSRRLRAATGTCSAPPVWRIS